MDNSIVLTGIIDSKCLFNLREKLCMLEADTEIIIYSTGGDLDCALAMFDLIQAYPYKITTTVIGKCFSAAIIPFIAGDIRKMYKHSCVLIHEPYASFVEEKRYTLKDVSFEEKRLILNNENLINLFEERTSLSRKAIEEFYAQGQVILTAEDCLKYNIATQII